MNEKGLPKAGLIHIRWHQFIFKQLKPSRIMRVEKGYRWQYVKRKIFMKTRGANYIGIWFGPLYIMFGMPWTEIAIAARNSTRKWQIDNGIIPNSANKVCK